MQKILKLICMVKPVKYTSPASSAARIAELERYKILTETQHEFFKQFQQKYIAQLTCRLWAGYTKFSNLRFLLQYFQSALAQYWYRSTDYHQENCV
jgi:hypothetical protein